MPPPNVWDKWWVGNAGPDQPRDEKGRWVSAGALSIVAEQLTHDIDSKRPPLGKRPIPSFQVAPNFWHGQAGTKAAAAIHARLAKEHEIQSKNAKLSDKGRALHAAAARAHRTAEAAHRREAAPSPDLAHEASMHALERSTGLGDHKYRAEEAAVLSERALESGNPAHHTKAAEAHAEAANAIQSAAMKYVMTRGALRSKRAQGQYASLTGAQRAHIRAAQLHERLAN